MTKHRWLLAWELGSVAAGAASLLVRLYVVALGDNPFERGLLSAVAAFLDAPGVVIPADAALIPGLCGITDRTMTE